MMPPNCMSGCAAQSRGSRPFLNAWCQRARRGSVGDPHVAHVAVAEPCSEGDELCRASFSTPPRQGTSYDWQRQELERMYEQDCSINACGTPFIQTIIQPAPMSALCVSNPPACTQFEVQLGQRKEAPNAGPPGDNGNKKERHDDFYANVGDAIRTLREDVPDLFKEELRYDIYREDVVFRDPRNCFRGIDNYKLIFWSLRFHGKLFFKDLYVEVKRIWQKNDDTICLRWTVHGFPRLPWDQEGTFDGVSTYKLDSHGKIYEHEVSNVILRDPPMQISPIFARLNLVPVAQSQPCPGAWFQVPPESLLIQELE